MLLDQISTEKYLIGTAEPPARVGNASTFEEDCTTLGISMDKYGYEWHTRLHDYGLVFGLLVYFLRTASCLRQTP